jgi:hydroxymethylpyrimidine kinase/phosphomethylpyrimidine kinase
MLGSGAVAAEVANFLEEGRPAHVVLDPVLRSSSGAPLIDEAALDILRKRLLPLSSLITPNGNEAAILAGLPCPGPERQWEAVKSDIRGLAERLHGLGARGVLITGGHIAEPVDYLSIQQSNSRTLCREFAGTHIESRSTHGTGCALATALAGLLGQGVDLPQAVADAKEYVRQAIIHGEPIGKGVGPLKHLYRR